MIMGSPKNTLISPLMPPQKMPSSMPNTAASQGLIPQCRIISAMQLTTRL